MQQNSHPRNSVANFNGNYDYLKELSIDFNFGNFIGLVGFKNLGNYFFNWKIIFKRVHEVKKRNRFYRRYPKHFSARRICNQKFEIFINHKDSFSHLLYHNFYGGLNEPAAHSSPPRNCDREDD